MGYSIMEALFDGKVIPWERKANLTAERKEIEKKIESEKRYFIEKMSLDETLVNNYVSEGRKIRLKS